MISKIAPADLNAHVLLAFAVILCASHAAGWIIARWGQTRVQGEILAGIMLGPSLLGALCPTVLDYLFPRDVLTALNAVAQLGVTLFMFLIGADLQVSALRGQGRVVFAVGIASMAVPAILGGLLALALHSSLAGGTPLVAFAFFVAVAMAISAFPVLVRVLRETGLSSTRIGVITTSCAAVDDIVAWSLLAVVVAMVKAHDLPNALWTVALSVIFIAVMVAVVRPLLRAVDRRDRAIPIWLVVTLSLACAFATEKIGVHAIFGAFLAGAILPRTPRYQRDLVEQLEPTVLTLLLPAFFVVVGLGVQINQLGSAYLLLVTVSVSLVAITGKLGGAALAARAVGETWRAAAAIGLLLNTRGLTELVVLSIGRQLGLISSTMFTIMVVMALATTLMATPLLKLLGLHTIAEREPQATERTRDDRSQILVANE